MLIWKKNKPWLLCIFQLKSASALRPQIPVFQLKRGSSLWGYEVPGQFSSHGLLSSFGICSSLEPTLRITGLEGTIQVQQSWNWAVETEKRLFPPQVENSESGNLGLLDKNKHASATLPQTLQNTKYTNSKSYIAPRIWRQSIIYNSYEKWSEGRADLRLIYLRNYHANHTNKIW